jgi:hypothetical protein
VAAKVQLTPPDARRILLQPSREAEYDNANPEGGAVLVPAGTELALAVSVRRTCLGGGHNSGTVRLWYDGRRVDGGSGRDAGSRFDATIGGAERDFFLRSGFALSEEAGTARVSGDAAVNSTAGCPDRPYTVVGTWRMTLP